MSRERFIFKYRNEHFEWSKLKKNGEHLECDIGSAYLFLCYIIVDLIIQCVNLYWGGKIIPKAIISYDPSYSKCLLCWMKVFLQ